MFKCTSPLEQAPSGAQKAGNALFRQGCYAEAIAQYDHALGLNLDDADLWVRRGNALQGLALLNSTLRDSTPRDSTRRNSTRPNSTRPNSTRRNSVRPNSRPQPVVAPSHRAETVFDRFSDCSDCLYAAIASYTTALQLNPAYPEALIGRAMALYHVGRYHQALANYDAALGMRADYSEDWYGRGLVLHQLGDYGAAIASYDRALHLHPTGSKIWVKRGVALQALGREAEALKSYDRAAIAPKLTLKPVP